MSTPIRTVRRTLTHAEHLAAVEAVDGVAEAVSHLLGTWYDLDLPGDALDGYLQVFSASLDEVDSALWVDEDGLRGLRVRRDLRPLREGERVRALQSIDRYPFGLVPEGALGEVVESTDEVLRVRFDGHAEEFGEWDGCVEWYGRAHRDPQARDEETVIGDGDYFGQTIDEAHAEDLTRVAAEVSR